MANISVRLPPDIEKSLDDEARLTERNRSELVREAVGEYLTRRQRDRLIDEMRQAAQALYSNPEVVAEMRQLQEEFDAVDTTLERIEAEERSAGVDPDAKWWE